MAKIAADRAIVLWNDEMDGDEKATTTRIAELHVFDIERQPHWADRLSSSRGACDADWLDGAWRNTPIGLLLELAVCDGFANKDVTVKALKEFAKIEGCEWASEILQREFGVERSN